MTQHPYRRLSRCSLPRFASSEFFVCTQIDEMGLGLDFGFGYTAAGGKFVGSPCLRFR